MGPAVLRRVCRWAVAAMAAGGVLSAQAMDEADLRPAAKTGEPGTYILPDKVGALPWMLPRASDPTNLCEPGDTLSARWSPDGRLLVSEIDSGRSVTLCRYDVSLFIPGKEGRRTVRVTRITSSGKLGSATSSGKGDTNPSARNDPPRRSHVSLASLMSGRSFTEFELDWAPPGYKGARVAFTRSSARLPPRVLGLTSAANEHDWSRLSLDGEDINLTPPYQCYQPSWGKTRSGQVALAMVTDHEISCEKRYIGLIIQPTEYRGPPQRLSYPCNEIDEQAKQNVADRYPAWSPPGTPPRVAFVRVALGAWSRTCVVDLEGIEPSRALCDFVPSDQAAQEATRTFPTWSADGRFLVGYVTPAAPGTNGESEVQHHIEVIDLNDARPRSRVVLEAVEPSLLQGPAVLTLGDGEGRRSWLLAVPAATAMEGKVVARRLDEDGTTRSFETGLQYVKAVSVVNSHRGTMLAIVAKGYRNVKNADLRYDKVFLMPLPEGEL